MKLKTLFTSAFICLMSLQGISAQTSNTQPAAPAKHDQTDIAIEKRLRLKKGKATVRGKSDYGTSYVYKLKAKKDQRLEVRVTSTDSTNINAVTFSVIPPGSKTLEGAAGVSSWTGVLPDAGEYSIVVVINTKGALKVPYTLEVMLQ